MGKILHSMPMSMLAASLAVLLPGTLRAEEYGWQAGGAEFSGWAGYGLVDVNTGSSQRGSRSALAMGLRAGYRVTPRTVVGLELSGWTLQAYDFNNPDRGESIGNASAYMDYWPLHALPLYLTLGGGGTSYVNNDPLAVPGRGKGYSWFLGGGYEYPVSAKVALVPQLRYSQGNFSGGDFRAYEISLGLKLHTP